MFLYIFETIIKFSLRENIFKENIKTGDTSIQILFNNWKTFILKIFKKL